GQVKKESPDSLFVLYALAYEGTNQIDSAMNMMQNLANKNPQSVVAHDYLATGELRQKNFAVSLEHGSMAVALRPSAARWDLLGRAYAGVELADSALLCFDKALEIDTTQSSYYFNRANTYWFLKKEVVSAYMDLTDAIRLDSLQGNYFALRGHVLMNDYPDAAYKNFCRAITLKDTSLSNFVARAATAAQLGLLDSARADLPRFKDSEEYFYWANLVKAQLALADNKPDVCLELTKVILSEEPTDQNFVDLKVRALLLKNLQKEALNYLNSLEYKKLSLYLRRTISKLEFYEKANSENTFMANKFLYFKDINAKNFDNLFAQTKKKKGKYAYKKLAEKYSKNYLSLSPDEWFMYYLGFSSRDNFSTVSLSEMQEDALVQAIHEERYDDCINEGLKVVEKDIELFPLYNIMAIAAMYAGYEDKVREFLYKSEAYYNAILATGTGNSTEEAMLVFSVNHEYGILEYLQYTSSRQTLLTQNGHSYDKLETLSLLGKPRDFYFMVDPLFLSYKKVFKK
ncbi:MAG: hypothetical protein RIS47_1386, partial [Bacteroidota bacterium]